MQVVFNMDQIASKSVNKNITRGRNKTAINGVGSSSKGRDQTSGGDIPWGQGHLDNIITLIQISLGAIDNQLVDPTPQCYTNAGGRSRRGPAASLNDIAAIGGGNKGYVLDGAGWCWGFVEEDGCLSCWNGQIGGGYDLNDSCCGWEEGEGQCLDLVGVGEG